MKLLTNDDIKQLFILLFCLLGGFMVLLQITIWLIYGEMSLAVLLLSAAAAVCEVGCCFYYFYRQNQKLEAAVSQINSYLSGETGSRIDCDREGSLYQLFHSVNTMATVLNAQLSKEQDVKEFLRNTISDISHQLKTPLAALSLYNGLLQDDNEDTAAVREFAKLSEQELDRMESLVQSLLKITRFDAGSIVIEKKQENMADMADEIKRYFDYRAQREQKAIELSGPGNADLFCDREWMVEAVGNLVKNSLDHTRPGCRVYIRWRRLPTEFQLIVADDGCGIHPEDINHIFKRFYRSRFSKDTKGIGLGLSLAKAITEAHGGNITAESQLHRGSTFTMSFPYITKM